MSAGQAEIASDRAKALPWLSTPLALASLLLMACQETAPTNNNPGPAATGGFGPTMNGDGMPPNSVPGTAGNGSTPPTATPGVPGGDVGTDTDPTQTPNDGTTPAVATPPPVGGWGTWASFGGDLSHTRHFSGTQRITQENVAQLKTAWHIDAPGVTATPTVVDGIIYWADWGGIVHANDIADQREVWRVDNSATGGGYTGSPAVTASAVYVANRNGKLSAHDLASGDEIWSHALDAGPHTHIWSSPVVVEEDQVLVIGVGGLGTRDNGRALPRSQLEGFRGWVEGVDALTGETLWQFQTTEGNGAGVSVWSSAAIDPVRKLAYIGTGNNYYRPVSPYSDSILAINYVTGELAWHHQFTANDAWTVGTTIGGGVDGDVGATPNLFTIGGRDLVGVGDKPGDYHVLDRETGDVVWETHLTNGGFQGGVMAPAAYADETIFVTSNNGFTSTTVFALDASDGAELWSYNMSATTFGGPAVSNGVVYVGDQDGNVAGLAAATGAELWKTRLGGARGGGFSLVDGILLTGIGFHFSESDREPLMGGLVALSPWGTMFEPPPAPSSNDCDPDHVLTADATFTNVYQGVLCATGCRACHGSAKQGGLGLESKASSHSNLVQIAAAGEACMAGGQTLVQPGDAAASLLYSKLAASADCGDAMPPGAPGNSPITSEMLMAVEAWIEAGAPNN